MRIPKVVALLGILMSAMQQARADIPNPGPVPGEAMPTVVAGVCLSLAVIFFGLWFVNRTKANNLKAVASKSAKQSPEETFSRKGS